MPGTPGNVAPIALRPGAFRCAKYQTPGAVRPRCGSFASSGLPPAVCAPLSAQLLDAPPKCSAREICGGFRSPSPYKKPKNRAAKGGAPGDGGWDTSGGLGCFLG